MEHTLHNVIGWAMEAQPQGRGSRKYMLNISIRRVGVWEVRGKNVRVLEVKRRYMVLALMRRKSGAA